MSGKVGNLTFSYSRNRPALENVSFEFAEHSVIGLAGPNGGGKSTLLKCLARLLTASSGAFTWRGRDFFRLPFREAAKKIGILPQRMVDPGYWTVSELAAQGRFLHGDVSIEHPVVAKVLEELKFSEFKHRNVSELSGGERQLAFLSLVLVKQPELLFLDEPDHFLDLKKKKLLSEVLRRQAKNGEYTVLVSSHDLNFLAQTCDRVLLLSEGRQVEYGPAFSVMNSPTVSEVFGVNLTPYQLSKDRLAMLADYSLKSSN